MTPVCRALWRRDVSSILTQPLGYLLIAAFVACCAMMQFRPQFFAVGLADLDPLAVWFPWILLAFVPALAMTSWAEERRRGTEELLRSLPARPQSIVIAKYLALVIQYAIALVFSLAIVIGLALLGEPDWGQMAATYVGFFLAGMALLSLGLLASTLSQTMPTAFVLGLLFCSVPIFIGEIPSPGDVLWHWSLPTRLHAFVEGALPLAGVLYFATIAVVFLCLAAHAVGSRYRSRSQQRQSRIQIAGLFVFGFAVVFLSDHFSVRVDATISRVHSLSPTTRAVLSDFSEGVMIQAFLSEEVPRDYVPVKRRFERLLREFESYGIDVQRMPVANSGTGGRESRAVGVLPRRAQSFREGRFELQDVYLGAVVTGPKGVATIPFISAGVRAEYDLATAVARTVRDKTVRVGILKTEAQMISARGEWTVVSHLRRVCDVQSVRPEELPEAKDQFDVLIAVLPSSLAREQLEHLVDYVSSGRPTLIFADPFPFAFSLPGRGVVLSPWQPRPPGQPLADRITAPKAHEGQLTPLLEALGIRWSYDAIVLDSFNAYPDLLAPTSESVFVSNASGTDEALGEKSPITRDLREVWCHSAGWLAPSQRKDISFTPLLKSGPQSVSIRWPLYVEHGDRYARLQGILRKLALSRGVRMRTDLPTPDRGRPFVLAAHIESGASINAVVVADVDVLWNDVIRTSASGDGALRPDNLAFVLNAVDVLAGREDWISLRKRASAIRPLTKFRRSTAAMRRDREQQLAEVDRQAEADIAAMQKRFATRIQAIRDDASLDAKARSLRLVEEQAAQRRLESVRRREIQERKQRERNEISVAILDRIRREERFTQLTLVLLIPLPVVFCAMIVLGMRRLGESQR